MILKRTVREDITRNLYESSNVLASTYNKKDKDLVVVFKNGGQYLYTGVEERDYMRFETADSQGKVLNSHIKKYPFSKIGDANLEKIQEEIENDRIILKKEKVQEIISNMFTVSDSFDMDNINDSTDNDLRIIKTMIDEYLNI